MSGFSYMQMLRDRDNRLTQENNSLRQRLATVEAEHDECRRLLRYVVRNTRIHNERDGKQHFLLSVTEGWYNEAAKAGGDM